MTTVLLFALILPLVFAWAAPRPFRLWLVVVPILGLGIVFLTGGLLNDHAAPAITGIVCFGMAAFFLVTGLRGRETEEAEELRLRIAEDLVFDARFVRGHWAWRWPKGWLELSRDHVRFRSMDGTVLFSFTLSEILEVRTPRFRRSQFTFRANGEKYEIAFGHSTAYSQLAGVTDARELVRARFHELP
jgi:hypothetical protein